MYIPLRCHLRRHDVALRASRSSSASPNVEALLHRMGKSRTPCPRRFPAYTTLTPLSADFLALSPCRNPKIWKSARPIGDRPHLRDARTSPLLLKSSLFYSNKAEILPRFQLSIFNFPLRGLPAPSRLHHLNTSFRRASPRRRSHDATPPHQTQNMEISPLRLWIVLPAGIPTSPLLEQSSPFRTNKFEIFAELDRRCATHNVAAPLPCKKQRPDHSRSIRTRCRDVVFIAFLV